VCRGWLIKKHFMWLDDLKDVELTEEEKIEHYKWYQKVKSILLKEKKDE